MSVFQNLGSAFEAQKQQAALSELMSQEQFKQLQETYDPTNNLALAKQAAAAQGNMPQLTTQVQASGVGEGIMKGLAAGIGNAQQMGAYKRQIKEIGKVQDQYNQAQLRQRELVLGQINAQAQADNATANWLEVNRPDLAAVYKLSGRAGRDALLSGIGTKEIGTTYQPKEAVSEEVGKQQVRQMRKTEFGDAPIEVGGIPQPARINQYQQIYGNAPVTSVDVEADTLANTGKRISNQSDANRLGVQPQQLQQEIQKNALDIQIKQVEAQFAEQAKTLQIKRDQLANQKNTLDYQKALKEYKNFEQGQALFKSLQESGALTTNDPNKQAEIQAQLGIYGVRYDPPNSKFTTLKHKNGTIYQIDNQNNMGRELINKNGKPVYGPWQEMVR